MRESHLGFRIDCIAGKGRDQCKFPGEERRPHPWCSMARGRRREPEGYTYSSQGVRVERKQNTGASSTLLLVPLTGKHAVVTSELITERGLPHDGLVANSQTKKKEAARRTVAMLKGADTRSGKGIIFWKPRCIRCSRSGKTASGQAKAD